MFAPSALPSTVQVFPSLPILSRSLDQLLSGALELDADDDESPEERVFFSQLESYLGRSLGVKRRRSDSMPSWCRDCRSCVRSRYGILELELSSS